MSEDRLRFGRLLTGAGGVLLIVSLFLPWAGAGETSRNGFELLAVGDVFLLIVGLVAIAAAVAWERIGFFRADVSLEGVADLLGVVASILLVWLVLFDFPSGATREIGVFAALLAAIAVFTGVGDYSPLRGAPLFPRLDAHKRPKS